MKKLLFCAAAVFARFPFPAFAADPGIDPAKLSEHIKVLSSDAFEGRGPATEGEKKTVAYISEQFKAAGLQPRRGDLVKKLPAWTQGMCRSPASPRRGPGEGQRDRRRRDPGPSSQGDQIAIRAAQTGISHLTVKDAPVVFVGYGVKAPERRWDDFKGYDLKGKIALVLVNDPDFETGKGDFGGKAMTYYGRWTYKYEEAARHAGALGFLVIHETAPAAYGWNTVKNSNTGEVFDIIRKDPSEAQRASWRPGVQRDATVDLFKKAGLDFDAAKKLAQTAISEPIGAEGRRLLHRLRDRRPEGRLAQRVVGVLPRTKHPDERIIYTAHWDHLGVGLPNAKGDKIYNGAVDNASGSSGLIELARAFAKAPRP